MESFFDLAKNRYSVRDFEAREIEQEKIDRIIEAARIAPTACNRSPQRIFIVKSSEKKEALAKVCPCTFNAPVIFVVGYDRTLAAKGKINVEETYGETDAAIVCTHMMFEAEDLGLGSCWVGWFASQKVSEALGLPEEVQVCDLLPVGYRSAECVPHEDHSIRRCTGEIAEEI